MISDDDKSIDSAPPPPPLPPPVLCDIAVADDASSPTNVAANYYKIEGSCLKILVAMCHDLRDDDDNPLISFEVELWKSFPVMQIRPNKVGYAKEVIHHWNQGQSGTQSNKLGPHLKQWNLPKIHDWLDQNPITD
jgi:hypothetical protein